MGYRSPYKIDDRKIHFALVGCGRISERHFDAIRKHQDRCELVAVCDSDPVVAAQHGEELKVEHFVSLETLLASSEADVVVLCTPSGLHPMQTVQVARAGRHVITEKPMATRLADGKRMVAECDNAGVRLFVVKQNRLNPNMFVCHKMTNSFKFL